MITFVVGSASDERTLKGSDLGGHWDSGGGGEREATQASGLFIR
jgi:hypothetical protein